MWLFISRNMLIILRQIVIAAASFFMIVRALFVIFFTNYSSEENEGAFVQQLSRHKGPVSLHSTFLMMLYLVFS